MRTAVAPYARRCAMGWRRSFMSRAPVDTRGFMGSAEITSRPDGGSPSHETKPCGDLPRPLLVLRHERAPRRVNARQARREVRRLPRSRAVRVIEHELPQGLELGAAVEGRLDRGDRVTLVVRALHDEVA